MALSQHVAAIFVLSQIGLSLVSCAIGRSGQRERTASTASAQTSAGLTTACMCSTLNDPPMCCIGVPGGNAKVCVPNACESGMGSTYNCDAAMNLLNDDPRARAGRCDSVVYSDADGNQWGSILGDDIDCAKPFILSLNFTSSFDGYGLPDAQNTGGAYNIVNVDINSCSVADVSSILNNYLSVIASKCPRACPDIVNIAAHGITADLAKLCVPKMRIAPPGAQDSLYLGCKEFRASPQNPFPKNYPQTLVSSSAVLDTISKDLSRMQCPGTMITNDSCFSGGAKCDAHALICAAPSDAAAPGRSTFWENFATICSACASSEQPLLSYHDYISCYQRTLSKLSSTKKGSDCEFSDYSGFPIPIGDPTIRQASSTFFDCTGFYGTGKKEVNP